MYTQRNTMTLITWAAAAQCAAKATGPSSLQVNGNYDSIYLNYRISPRTPNPFVPQLALKGRGTGVICGKYGNIFFSAN